MSYSKTQIIFGLLGILAILYATNIYFNKKVTATLVDTPVKISFMVVEPPQNVCKDCFDTQKIIKMIDRVHNIKYKTSDLSYDNVLSQKYIKTYNIKNLPAIIVSGEVKNKEILSAWKALAGKKVNGRIVIENLLPFYDLKSGKVKGVISAILLKDKTCQKCFDENEYIKTLEQFGMVVSNTTVYDIASKKGRGFVKKYNITKVPTMILSPDAGDYSGLKYSWKEVGTVEKNGWYVFREVQKQNPNYEKI